MALKAAPLFANAWLKNEVGIGFVTLTVKADRTCEMSLSLRDNAPAAFHEALTYTDFPEGEWKFYLATDEAEDGYITNLYLPREH